MIELSRIKLVMTIGGALLFVAAGAWFFLAPADGSFIRDMGRFAPPWAIHALGVVAALFGIAGVVYGVRKSFDQKPGLVLGATGLVDNSSAVAAGFIPWSEVTGLSLFQMRRQRMLIVHVADPEKYIARGNALQRMLNRANTGMVGSPISISSNALRIPFDELQREIASYLTRYGSLVPDAVPDDAAWDRKLEADVAAGRLDGLAADALAEHRAGRSRPL